MCDTFVALDLEMTGLKVRTDRILEIGGLRVENGTVTDMFQTFVNPHRKLDEKIVKLTGINQDMISDAPEAEEALAEFLDFAGDLPLLGHNLIFDYSFLKQAAVNAGFPFERRGIDTLRIARKVLQEPESKSLDELCVFFGIPRERKHRAKEDAAAAAKLFFLLKEQYGSQFPELFRPGTLQYRVKKQGKITSAQKRDLNHLIIYHRIEAKIEIDSMTRSEASRMIDRIYAVYGRIPGTGRNGEKNV